VATGDRERIADTEIYLRRACCQAGGVRGAGARFSRDKQSAKMHNGRAAHRPRVFGGEAGRGGSEQLRSGGQNDKRCCSPRSAWTERAATIYVYPRMAARNNA